jgi:hypothetical protein
MRIATLIMSRCPNLVSSNVFADIHGYIDAQSCFCAAASGLIHRHWPHPGRRNTPAPVTKSE